LIWVDYLIRSFAKILLNYIAQNLLSSTI